MPARNRHPPVHVWSNETFVGRKHPWRTSPVAKIFVAIPARDEAERIGPCLTALNEQIQPPDAVVLMLNNCSDRTERIARAMAPGLRFELDVIHRTLPPAEANAGHARRLVMALAAERAGPDGVLLTTDADAVVPPDWIARNSAALRRGVDVVCGRAVIDPAEAAVIPAHLHADDARECRLIAMLNDIAWALDPEPHDPPARHTEASGASLAVRAEAFHRAGGIPAIAAGEDREFVRALWMMDARVRHDPNIRVTVSGRVVGRAEGGMAEAIRRRMIQQDEFTDDQVEPAPDAFGRYGLRNRARRAWLRDRGRRGWPRHPAPEGQPAWDGDTELGLDLAVSDATLATAMSRRFFGAAWAELEAVSPVLKRRRVRFVDLPAEIAAAEALLDRLTLPEILAAD